MLSCALIFASLQTPKLELDYQDRSGLRLTVQGIELIRGSFFQYYEGNWARGLYSSNWENVKIDRSGSTITVTFTSREKRASGRLHYAIQGTKLEATYEFRWDGQGEVHVENTVGILWSEPFARGMVKVNGIEQRKPSVVMPPKATEEERFFGPSASLVEVESQFARLVARAEGEGIRLLDGRGLQQDWAERSPLFWLGTSRVVVSKDKPATYRVTLDLSKMATEPPKRQVEVELRGDEHTISEPPAPIGIIPTPKEMSLGEGKTELPGRTDPDPQVQKFLDAFWAMLENRWSGLKPGKAKVRMNPNKMMLPEGAFNILAKDSVIEIKATDTAGLQYAGSALAQLYGNRDGAVGLPEVTIRDWPSIGWRGVHMFVGPKALEFQTDLMERVLAPCRINQVVLQCEQTAWDSLPKIKTSQSMSKAHLRELVGRYWANGIEPTPLIQSWGHMRWFFANQQNLDVAWNPENAFGIDPRKPEARERVAKIWREAVEIFKPKIAHFGLDEVDLNGFIKDPKLITELWEGYVPHIAKLSQELKVTPMFWSDKALAPGEAPDACHGDTKADAKRRRAALPKGSYIGDWHYKNDPNPAIYTSLELWKNEGLNPIATTWNREGNIRGFFSAAAKSGVGVLQSTWAGYTSFEEAMLSEFSQMASYIFAAECAWNGGVSKLNPPNQIPLAALRERFYGPVHHATTVKGRVYEPITARDGKPLSPGIVFGDESYDRWFLDLSGENSTAFISAFEGNLDAPSSIQMRFPSPVREGVLRLTCQTRLREGAHAATLTLIHDDGTRTERIIRYGYDLRAANDAKPAYRIAGDGKANLIPFGVGKNFKAISLSQHDWTLGLRVTGIQASLK